MRLFSLSTELAPRLENSASLAGAYDTDRAQHHGFGMEFGSWRSVCRLTACPQATRPMLELIFARQTYAFQDFTLGLNRLDDELRVIRCALVAR